MDREEEFLHEQMIILLKEIAVDVLDANTLQRKPRKLVVIDTMVVVQNLSPKPVWMELYEGLPKFFLDKLDSQTEGYSEVKLVFDTYEEKKATRKSRRHGEVPVRYKVSEKKGISRT